MWKWDSLYNLPADAGLNRAEVPTHFLSSAVSTENGLGFPLNARLFRRAVLTEEFGNLRMSALFRAGDRRVPRPVLRMPHPRAATQEHFDAASTPDVRRPRERARF